MSPYEAIYDSAKLNQCKSCGEVYPSGMSHECKGIPMELKLQAMSNIAKNDAGEATGVTIDMTLAERGSRYGSFQGHAQLAQDLKYVLAKRGFYQGTNKFTPVHREAMDMILHKIARIVNGDPNYDDSWRDIAGYAQLVVDKLNGKNT